MEITDQNIIEYLKTIEEERLEDIKTLLEIGIKLTNKEPKMWGSIVGFGSLHYKYKTGHEGDMPIFGFANRKRALTLYISYNLEEYSLLNKLGKYKLGKSCLYIKKLRDINLDILIEIIQKGITDMLSLDYITNNE